MTPCVVLGAAMSQTSVKQEEVIGLEQPHFQSGTSECDDKCQLQRSQAADFIPMLDDESSFEESWQDNEGNSASLFHHEWYLRQEACIQEYEIPVLFEDGMDFVECELYYAAHEQGSGGFAAKKGLVKNSYSNIRERSTAVSFHKEELAVPHSLHSCLRRSTRRPTLPITPTSHEDASLFEWSSHWLYAYPGLRRCSYSGMVTTTSRKKSPIVSTTPPKYFFPTASFVGEEKNVYSRFEESHFNSSSCDLQVENAMMSKTNTTNQFSSFSSSSPVSSKLPNVAMPRIRHCLLESHHRKSKSQSELLDMIDPFVSFAPMVQVVTIPAAWEYPAEIRRNLWHTQKELKVFLRQTASEKRRRRHRKLQKELNDKEDDVVVSSPLIRSRRKKQRGNKEHSQNEESELKPFECEYEEGEKEYEFFLPLEDCSAEILDRLDRVP